MTATRKCRFCSAGLRDKVLDLGLHPFSNSYVLPEGTLAEKRYPLRIWVCSSCWLVQTDFDAPTDEIFSESYAYFSSMSASWLRHAKSYAESMTARLRLDRNSLVVEVASNDGYLLQHFLANGVPVLGVEPTKSTAQAAIAKGIRTRMEFFGEESGKNLAKDVGQADLIAANNVLAHVPNIRDFARGFTALLKPQGVATFEFPHVKQLLDQVQFDTIYHEHYSYLSLCSVERIFLDAGLIVFDVEELPTHGGSLRVYAALADSGRSKEPSVDSLRENERQSGLMSLNGYAGLAPKAAVLRETFLEFADSAAKRSKNVAGYGAAAKGNTFLNFCGVRAPTITMVADKSLLKQGKLLPGSHIPVVTPERLIEAKPDYIVIFPWNIADEIAEQLAPARDWGAKFVTAIPNLKIF